VRAPEFAHSQDGTLHFRHLVDGDGVVQVAASLDQHVAQVRAVLDGDSGWARRARTFVQAFVRPHGLDEPAAPIFARTIGALAAQPRPAARPDGALIVLARGPALLLAYLAR